MRDQTTTDGSADDWQEWDHRVQHPKLVPRLRILYHRDLDRIGATTRDDAFFPAEHWVTLGRNAPFFSGAVHALDRPLDDTKVSRKQLRLRWRPKDEVFEIEPVQGSRKSIGLLPAAQDSHLGSNGQLAVETIHSRTEVPPGYAVAIGDRVLLGFELGEPGGCAERDGALVGCTDALVRLRRDIRDIAMFDRPALLIGQTGAGKELVARAIHDASARARRPFVTVNCAALPEQLVESLLFGHRRGAFTGAATDQAGVFAAADGGTLFLDELGELPLGLQPKFLRVLQDGIVTPVGGHRGKEVDVRVVAATNRNLQTEMHEGRLRADLYHRVAGHLLGVPPLSARVFDIPELFVHFLRGIVGRHEEVRALWSGSRSGATTIPISFFARLIRTPWPGNVRQLQNIAERTARLNLRGGAFRSPELKELALAGANHASGVHPARRPKETTTKEEALAHLGRTAAGLDLAQKTVTRLIGRDAIDAFWSQADEEAWTDKQVGAALTVMAADSLFASLETNDFNQSRVAQSLAMSRTTLAKLMTRFGLPRAADFDLQALETALAASDGHTGQAARRLRLSPRAFKRRLTLLRMARP